MFVQSIGLFLRYRCFGSSMLFLAAREVAACSLQPVVGIPDRCGGFSLSLSHGEMHGNLYNLGQRLSVLIYKSEQIVIR